MTHLGYLIAAWGISLGALAAYAIRVTARGRQLAARVPAERRRWMTTEDPS